MAKGFDDIVGWIDDNPLLAGGIIVVGGLAVLWYFGYFTPPAKSDAGGQTNMAAAYYAAEAAQTVSGTQLAMAQAGYTADTAQASIAADAAVKINAANNDAEARIAATNASRDTLLGEQDLTASLASTHDAMQTALGEQSTSLEHDRILARSQHYETFLNTILPQELALGHGYAAGWLPDIGEIGVGPGQPTPDQLRQAGYSEAQLRIALGFPAGTP